MTGRPSRRYNPSGLLTAGDAPLAERYGVSERTIQRWRTEGIPAEMADEVAVAAGFHPLELWTDFYQEAP